MKEFTAYIITFVFAFILFIPFCLAQKGTIDGTVQGTEGALQGATVSAGTVAVTTNYKGEFSFAVNQGDYTLHVTHSGYKKIVQEISVVAGNRQSLIFSLIPDEQMGEVVVLGSRSMVQRSNLSTPVPVDVVSAKQLVQTGQASLTQMLNILVPSFNASREILNEPSTLRGLDPQHVLILLDGIRYHNMAFLYQGGLKGQLGRGSVANDLNSIPVSAIEKIEILRDGASAQYGSDAIAGVINIRLKESIGKTSLRFHSGQYYKGDGEKLSFGINGGVSLNKRGFLNFSGDFRYQAPTYRGGAYTGTVYKNYPARGTLNDSLNIKAQDDSIIKARGFNRQAIKDNIGNFKSFTGGVLVNGGYTITNRSEIFWKAAYNKRSVYRDAEYRYPKNTNQVNLALYPDGFQAKTIPDTEDVLAIAGVKGETKNHWFWNVSSSYGNNSLDSRVTNTNNASQYYQGKDAQTDFYAGKQMYHQLTNNINYSKNVSGLPNYIQSLNLGWGAEWRIENYETKKGEEASWENFDASGVTQAGSQGSAGRRPEDVVDKTRNAIGAYIDLETEIKNGFLFDLAGRYEHYSDFGGNLAVKLATLYKISNHFSLRASINNGFRAPSLQQRYNRSTQTGFTTTGGIRIPSIRGVFPTDHAVASALGIPSLTAERTINMSGGFTAKLFSRISLTVDFYWIQIKNRIILSGIFQRRSNRVLDSILLLSLNLNQIDQVAFFSNAINTRTAGADVVLNGHWSTHHSDFQLTLAANINRTRIFGVLQSAAHLAADSLNTNTLLNRAERGSVERGQPEDKITLSMNYRKGPAGLIFTNTRFGRTIVFHETAAALDEFFAGKLLTDISVYYKTKSSLTITLGANNVFNVYPDQLRHQGNNNQGIWVYSPEASPFGFNGGYYFVNMSFSF